MPKATLEFQLPEENEEYKTTMQAGAFYCALWEISQGLFRQIRKYGTHSNPKIQALLDKDKTGDLTKLVVLLEEQFSNILDDQDIEL